jgi:predicted Zn-dependent peptidase
MIDYSKNPASYDFRLQGFSLQPLLKSINNNIPIYGYTDINIGISYLELVFSTGKLTDENKAVSAILARLFPYLQLNENQTLFELLEFYGAKLSFEASSTHSSIKLYALSTDFQEIVRAVTLALKQPVWTDLSFSHCQHTLAKDVKTRQLEKKTVGDKTFNTHFYKGTSLANSLLLSDIAACTSEVIKLKIEELFTQLDFVLTVNLEPQKLDLSLFRADKDRDEIPHAFVPKRVKVFPRLNKEQSLIQSITPLCSVHSSQYPLYYFYNQILGGSFQSILSQEIREKQGLTYGIHSSLLSVNNESYLKINSTTPFQKGGEVLDKIEEITNEFDSYLSEEYIDQIKKIASATFLKNMENIFSQLALQKNILLSGLSQNFYSDLLEGIKEVTREDLLKANHVIQEKGSLKLIIE